VLADAVEKAAKDPEFVKFANERNTRWGYIPPAQVVSAFDSQRTTVREIMSKAGILKEAK
jgi:tripartite-type tricarboxylate transporter receptor subunit TctC